MPYGNKTANNGGGARQVNIGVRGDTDISSPARSTQATRPQIPGRYPTPGRVPRTRFTVTCGEAEAPLVTTRKITREDLRKLDGDYLYVVE